MTQVQIIVVTAEHRDEFLRVYENVFSTKEELQAFYGKFLENGWISGALKRGELIGVLTWTPRESVNSGLAEIVDIWVETEERRKGIGGELVDHAINQMQQYYRRFGATLHRVMLFTGAQDRYLAARALYEKKHFHAVAKIPRCSLSSSDGEELLYVLRVT